MIFLIFQINRSLAYTRPGGIEPQSFYKTAPFVYAPPNHLSIYLAQLP